MQDPQYSFLTSTHQVWLGSAHMFILKPIPGDRHGNLARLSDVLTFVKGVGLSDWQTYQDHLEKRGRKPEWKTRGLQEWWAQGSGHLSGVEGNREEWDLKGTHRGLQKYWLICFWSWVVDTQGFHFNSTFHVLLCLHICIYIHTHTTFKSSMNIHQYQRLANDSYFTR